MTRYIEFVVHADDRDLKPYLTGYIAAGALIRWVFADEAGFHIKQLRERIRHRGEVQHVMVEETHAARIRAALAAASPRYRFEAKEEHTFEAARFSFECKTPSRKIAEKLKATLAKLPVGIKLDGFLPREDMNPGASSAEMYAPEHDYEFTARGTIAGDVFAVIDLRAALGAIDFIDCSEIEVVA